jgi:hypothetical protein
MNTLFKYLLVLALALPAFACDEEDTVVVTLNVDSEQKISETRGNFEGVLGDSFLGDILPGDILPGVDELLDDGSDTSTPLDILDITPDSNSRFGSAVAIIGDLEADGVSDLAVGAPYDNDGGKNRGAVWILFMDADGTVDLEAKISNTEGNFIGNLEDDDRFGSAITGIGDLDGDGFNDIAVGAPFDDENGDNRGAVWILFLRADGTVKASQKIADGRGNFFGDLDDDDQFGTSITTFGDLDGDGLADLAVGAPLDDDDGINTGAVWVLFMNSNGTVRAHQKISADTGFLLGILNAGNDFGRSVANIGDLNRDGMPDLAVGSPGDDDGGLDRGAIWILYMNANGTVKTEKKISVTETKFDLPINDNDGFGQALGNAGDVNRDGVTDLLVGAPFDDSRGADSGAVWILFMNRQAKVREITRISGTDGTFRGNVSAGDNFGAAVAGIGNLDKKREVDLAIGAPLDDDGGIDKGALWILFMDEADTRTECERDSLLRFFNVGECE